MIKKIFFLLTLLLGVKMAKAQYEIRHNLTFGLNYSNLYAKKVDKEKIIVNIDSHTVSDEGVDSITYRANSQDTYLDYSTVGTVNWFVGYKMTLDFNKRYSFDVGLILNKKGFETKINTDYWSKDLTWNQFYESTKYFPLAGYQYRYHEEYEVYRLEIPFYMKVNVNTMLSVYGGMNFGFQMHSSDKNKPLGTRSITNTNGSVVVGQYYVESEFDADLVLGLDAMIGKQFSLFIQGEYGVQSLDANRETGIRFYGLKVGMNYVFKRI